MLTKGGKRSNRFVSRSFKALIVCVVAGAVVAGAAFSGSTSRRAGSPLDEPSSLLGGLIPLPPGAWSVTSVGDALEVNGISMRMAHFLVDLEPVEVVSFYVDSFYEEGLDVDVTAMRTDSGGLVAWDHERGLQRVVTVFGQGQGSVVFPSLAAIEPAKSEDLTKRPLPPGPTGARLISDVVGRDGRRLSRTVSMVTDLPMDEATDDLIARLELAGHVVSPAQLHGSGRIIEVKDSGGRRLVYTMTGAEGQVTSVMVVMEGLER